jgi:hypothetical protein
MGWTDCGQKYVYYSGAHFPLKFLPSQAQQGVGSAQWQPCM